jgi:hypothetical protein
MFDQKFSLPSTGTILGFIAVLISLGGAAYAAGALVTIADPITAARARVNAGRLEVSVDETVTTRLAAPATTFHNFNSVGAGPCVILATPPAGTAFIIQQVRVNTYQNPSPGVGQVIILYSSTNCTGPIRGTVNPPTIGLNSVTFGPGLNIPQGQALSVRIGGSIAAEIYTDGFSLPAALVPALSEIAESGATISKQTQVLQRQ